MKNTIILCLGASAILSLAACGEDAVQFGQNIVDNARDVVSDIDVSDGADQSDTTPGDTSTLDITIEDTAGTDTREDTTAAGVDCIGILECASQCQDQDCLLECQGEGTPDAQDQFGAFATCIGTNCAEATTDAEYQSCVLEFCADEYSECTGENIPDPGNGTCPEIFECALGCSNQACADDCLAQGDPAAQQGLIDLYNCGVDNCADAATVDEFAQCTEDSCPDEYAACYE